jgi:hypothetical protein
MGNNHPLFILTFMEINLQQALRQYDIYLFDQLLKGRFNHCKKCWMLAAAAA